MPIYRVEVIEEEDSSRGFEYFGSKRAAAQYAAARRREFDPRSHFAAVNIEEAPTPTTKGGVLRLLRLWGSHPDNG